MVVSFSLYVLLSATFRGACETFTDSGQQEDRRRKSRSVMAPDSTDEVGSNL